MMPSPDACVLACQSRDERFDGWFILGVITTNIYCRPSCSTPIRPKPHNMRFFPTAAAAQRAGFRACKRCRPDASPGSPEWSHRADLVGRAMRLIADGEIDRTGVSGVAHHLAVSPRHLHRLLLAEVGAPPLALARAQRAQTARILIETTSLPFADVAFAAGFTSVRQFNDTVRDVFATTPSMLRGRGATRQAAVMTDFGTSHVTPQIPSTVQLRIAVRQPFDAGAVFGFLAALAIPGVEHWDGHSFMRTLRLPGGPGLVVLQARAGHLWCQLRLTHIADVAPAVARYRRLLDVDTDPAAISDAFAGDLVLQPLVSRRPGLRSPGAVDGTEMVVRAIVGQQVSVAGARTVLGKIVAAVGESIKWDGTVRHLFPSAAALLAAPDEVFPMPVRRRETLREVCAAIVEGRVRLNPGVSWEELRQDLRKIPGIGEWTAEYVAMRALNDPDAFPAGDLVLRRAWHRHSGITAPTALAETAQRWRPWRAYAAHHLWKSEEDS
ncbi:MAG: DNA-3-methyladenine glycosylase 2 family protein [Actinomycetota bacterium]